MANMFNHQSFNGGLTWTFSIRIGRTITRAPSYVLHLFHRRCRFRHVEPGDGSHRGELLLGSSSTAVVLPTASEQWLLTHQLLDDQRLISGQSSES